MPKATIYNRDGTIFRETDCVEIQPYCGEFRLLILKKDENALRSDLSFTDEHLITNLPILVEGVGGKNWRQPEDTDPYFYVSLMGDDGTELKHWCNVRGIGFQSGLMMFKADGKWNTICGNVVTQPQEQKDGD